MQQQYRPSHDADIDALLDDMERDYAREDELEIADLKLRIAEQDKVIAELTQRLQKPHGDPKAQPAEPEQPKNTPDPVAATWVAQNSWFNTDEEMHDYALTRETRLLKSIPDTAKRLEKVKQAVVQRFPEKFENQARRQPSTVSAPGGQVMRSARPKGPTLATLDDDAKAALAEFKKIDPTFTDETYIKIYRQRR
jgi:hypothetical protein